MRSALTLPRRKPLKKEGALPSSVGNWKTLAAAVAGPRKEPSACEDHCEVRFVHVSEYFTDWQPMQPGWTRWSGNTATGNGAHPT